MTEEREYRVKVSVRNNLLLRAIEIAGFKSVSEFARSAGVPVQSVITLVGLRQAPIGKGGSFTDTAKAVMEALGAAPTDLWTEEQLTMQLRHNSGERAVSYDSVMMLLEQHSDSMLLPNPEQIAMSCEQGDVVNRVLDTLTPIEAKVLRMRFGIGCSAEQTNEVIGEAMDRCGSRIQQIEKRALRKMRDPKRARALLDVTPIDIDSQHSSAYR